MSIPESERDMLVQCCKVVEALNDDRANYWRIECCNGHWEVWDKYGQHAGQEILLAEHPDVSMAILGAYDYIRN
jgi:hypothetical protein